MQISAKTDYACRALVELALHWPNQEPLQINTISERQRIPVKFLTQILIALKQMGYTQSLRGKKGGYLLAVKPAEIKLMDLLSRLGSRDFRLTEEVKSDDVMTSIWNEINKSIAQKLETITMETIANRKKQSDKTVSFEI